jgi:hypothetical protein
MMARAQATRVPPENARLIYSFVPKANRAAFWGLNLAAIPLFFLSGAFFITFLSKTRPGIGEVSADVVILESKWQSLALLLGLAILQLTIHELVHGLFLWLFTRTRPVYGFRGWYAYASAPGWYFPRSQYLIICLAPLILISLLCMLLLLMLPFGLALAAVLFTAVANAASSVGDLWYSLKILSVKPPLLVEDIGEGFRLHALS